MNESDVLSYNPFDGDFGSPGDVTLKDKLVMVRKSGSCHHCGLEVKCGTVARSMSGIFDGTLMSWRWCADCCEAMAFSFKDDGEAISARYKLSIKMGQEL